MTQLISIRAQRLAEEAARNCWPLLAHDLLGIASDAEELELSLMPEDENAEERFYAGR